MRQKLKLDRQTYACYAGSALPVPRTSSDMSPQPNTVSAFNPPPARILPSHSSTHACAGRNIHGKILYCDTFEHRIPARKIPPIARYLTPRTKEIKHRSCFLF